MVDFSGVAVAMQKLNKKFKKAQQNWIKIKKRPNKTGLFVCKNNVNMV